MKLTNIPQVLAVAALSMCVVTHTSASMITFSTPTGANIDGELVDAEVTLTTSADTVDIELRNLLGDPTSVKQVITGIFFELSTGETVGTVTSIAGEQRDIAGDGSYTDLGIGNSGWTATTSGSEILVDILNFPGQPKSGVVGPPNGGTDNYDNANGSIAGNGSHNPFFAETANISVNVPGVTMDSRVRAVTFQFNTTPGDNIRVPEPSAASLLLASIVGLIGMSRRR